MNTLNTEKSIIAESVENAVIGTKIYSFEADKGGVGKTVLAVMTAFKIDQEQADFEKKYGRKANILVQSVDPNESLYDIFDEQRKFTAGYNFNNNVIADYFDYSKLDTLDYFDKEAVEDEIYQRLYMNDGKVRYQRKNFVFKSEDELDAEIAEQESIIDDQIESGQAAIVEEGRLISYFAKLQKRATHKSLEFLSGLGLGQKINDEILPKIHTSLFEPKNNHKLCVEVVSAMDFADVVEAIRNHVEEIVQNGELAERLKEDIQVSQYKVEILEDIEIDFLVCDTPANFESVDFAQDNVFIIHSLNELVSGRSSVKDLMKKIEKQIEPYVLEEQAVKFGDIPSFTFVMNSKRNGTNYVEEQKQITDLIEKVKASFKENYDADINLDTVYFPYANYDNFFKHRINFMTSLKEVNADRELVKKLYKEEGVAPEVKNSIKSPLENTTYVKSLDYLASQNVFAEKLI